MLLLIAHSARKLADEKTFCAHRIEQPFYGRIILSGATLELLFAARSQTVYSVHIVVNQFRKECFQSARVCVLTLDPFRHSRLCQDEAEKHIFM